MSNLIRVLRLEEENGAGVYRNAWEVCCGDTLSSDVHPMAHHEPEYLEDEQRYIDEHSIDVQDPWSDGFSNRRFGFYTPEQFLSWVYEKEWRQNLDNYGIKISIYECERSDCIIGNSQMTFDTTKAELVDRVSVTYFDED